MLRFGVLLVKVCPTINNGLHLATIGVVYVRCLWEMLVGNMAVLSSWKQDRFYAEEERVTSEREFVHVSGWVSVRD